MNDAMNQLSDAQRLEVEQQIMHATRVMFEATKNLNELGVSAPAIATACATTYVNFVGAMAFTLGLDKSTVLENCKSALDSMNGFVDDLYQGLTDRTAANTAAAESSAP